MLGLGTGITSVAAAGGIVNSVGWLITRARPGNTIYAFIPTAGDPPSAVPSVRWAVVDGGPIPGATGVSYTIPAGFEGAVTWTGTDSAGSVVSSARGVTGRSAWAWRPGDAAIALTGVSVRSGNVGAYTPTIVSGRPAFSGGGRGAPDGAVLRCTYPGGLVDVTVAVAVAVEPDAYACRSVLDLTDLRLLLETRPGDTIRPIYFRDDLWSSVGDRGTAPKADALALASAGNTPGFEHRVGGDDLLR